MREQTVVECTSGQPATVDSLYADMIALGIFTGQVLVVHASLSALGWVCGGAVAVILALEKALSDQGTLVMPAHSGDLSDPGEWKNPPVPAEWWQVIRATMPPYDVALTPTRAMGVIAETFRKQAGVVRSGHPQVSFAAWGTHAVEVTSAHELDFGLGESSPLARVYDLDGWILLLGVGHDRNTSLHLAEYRASYPGKRETRNGAPLFTHGQRDWVELRDILLDDTDFERIGQSFSEMTGEVRGGRIGNGQAWLMPQRTLVDYAVNWMVKHRGKGVA
jgi:aminoglycoside 3-N-acetyltransferase